MKKMYKMNKEVKAKWLEALRSGNYRQAQGTLVKKVPTQRNRYCCLGVLCALHAKETGNKFVEDDYLGDTTGLPKAVMKWAGVASAGDLNKKVEGASCLIELNDDMEYNFREIANVIEEQF